MLLTRARVSQGELRNLQKRDKCEQDTHEASSKQTISWQQPSAVKGRPPHTLLLLVLILFLSFFSFLFSSLTSATLLCKLLKAAAHACARSRRQQHHMHVGTAALCPSCPSFPLAPHNNQPSQSGLTTTAVS